MVEETASSTGHATCHVEQIRLLSRSLDPSSIQKNAQSNDRLMELASGRLENGQPREATAFHEGARKY